MAAELNEATKYRIKHVPSWYFQLIKDQTIDLVTASWVLNEVSDSGILWIMANSMRSLRKGGYFYIRDSFKLKPMRHSVDYDKLLLENGFVEVGRLNVRRNREDFYGIPRAYQKTSDSSPSFDELIERWLGHFAVTAHGGGYHQNLPESRT